MHCETDELLATMLVNVDRQVGVNLEGGVSMSGHGQCRWTHNAET